MNEREENKELIQQIAETLRHHAEPYKEGAWERFSAAQGLGRSRKRVLWPYWSAAAVLLAVAGLLWLNPEPDMTVPQVADLTELPARTEPKENLTPSVSEKETTSQKPVTFPVQQETVVEDEDDEVIERPLMAQATAPAPEPSIHEKGVEEEMTIRDQPTVVAEIPEEASEFSEPRLAVTEPPVRSKTTTKEALSVMEEGHGRNVGNQAARKWDVGVAVAPSMTSEKLNLSGGISVAYQLSDKLSVGSGVSIGRLGMAENPNYDPYAGRGAPPMEMEPSTPGATPSLTNNVDRYKRDRSLTSNVVALDIPLDLRYEVFKGFYTSVGVSYVAVLSEQRTEHYIGGINETSFSGSKGGDRNLESSTTVGYRSEKMDVQPLKGKGYTGFMNFSIGRKMPLSKHLFFSVEPYFKLPIGQLSREQMDFTNGGIRIVTGF